MGIADCMPKTTAMNADGAEDGDDDDDDDRDRLV